MLEIESIETTPIRVPLDRTYKGSFYSMPNRCTIITRLRTSDGVVGEIYNADTDGNEQLERMIEVVWEGRAGSMMLSALVAVAMTCILR